MSSVQRALTPADAGAAACLHATGFPDPWSEAAFAAQLRDARTLSLGHVEEDELIAFALCLEVAGEADLLTVVVHPARRGEGLARALIKGLTPVLAARGTARLTLEVAEDNASARRLYAALGFTEDGRRPRYYAAGRDVPADAVLMSKSLSG